MPDFIIYFAYAETAPSATIRTKDREMIKAVILFFFFLSDIMFNEYKLLVDEISNKFKQYDSTLIIRYSWLTNGVFEKYDRVLDLLKYSNGTISFSYDPIGRFSNDTQLDQMLRCYAFFK